MASWLLEGEELVGEGSGEGTPCTSKLKASRSPLPGRGRRHTTSSPKEVTAELIQQGTMGKAKELFVLCDKEGKGFITKRDMQRLQGELPLSPEQLESVFESLDREKNGFLTALEFNMGLGEFVGGEETREPNQPDSKTDQGDPGAIRFTQILVELGAHKLKDQWELSALWCELHQERPELTHLLEEVLVQAVSHLQDSLRERDSLEQAICRRESEHDQVVRSIYEEMESQVREEREKWLAQDNKKQCDRTQQLQKDLKLREQELEIALAKQRELEQSIQVLSCELAETQLQNHKVQSQNAQLQEQLEASRQELQSTQAQLQLLHTTAAHEQMGRERNVLKVSKNMQKEKDSLIRQLELLRDMSKRLRDEKDAHHSQKMTPSIRKPLLKKGSIIGNYLPHNQTISRQLSSPPQGEEAPADGNKRRREPSGEQGDRADGELEGLKPKLSCPQRVFRVVFLGNSGVGKSSFIHHYCRGYFPNNMTSTVGIDFQVRSVQLGLSSVALQLWDTAGQERFRSITQQYFRKADAILAMYDITHAPSFTAVRGWMDCVQEKTDEGAVLMLLGNKTDIPDGQQREVATGEGQRLAEQYQAVFYECSAKNGDNVEELMTHLARLLAAQQDKQCEDTLLLVNPSNSRGRCCK